MIWASAWCALSSHLVLGTEWNLSVSGSVIQYCVSCGGLKQLFWQKLSSLVFDLYLVTGSFFLLYTFLHLLLTPQSASIGIMHEFSQCSCGQSTEFYSKWSVHSTWWPKDSQNQWNLRNFFVLGFTILSRLLYTELFIQKKDWVTSHIKVLLLVLLLLFDHSKEIILCADWGWAHIYTYMLSNKLFHPMFSFALIRRSNLVWLFDFTPLPKNIYILIRREMIHANYENDMKVCLPKTGNHVSCVVTDACNCCLHNGQLLHMTEMTTIQYTSSSWPSPLWTGEHTPTFRRRILFAWANSLLNAGSGL